jgi:hypothetical protein
MGATGLKVVGAGVGRTGTHSLKVALEQLLGGRCYHMLEVFGRPGDAVVWAGVFRGQEPDWHEFMADFDAAVDWPAGGAWRELAAAFPDAPVLLSTRDPDSWWKSASNTIFERLGDSPDPAWNDMIDAMLGRFTRDYMDEDAAKAAFVAHNEAVRAEVPPERLIEWQPGDGWGPLCEGLGLDVPDTPFPHLNTTEEFRAMTGLDGSEPTVGPGRS